MLQLQLITKERYKDKLGQIVKRQPTLTIGGKITA